MQAAFLKVFRLRWLRFRRVTRCWVGGSNIDAVYNQRSAANLVVHRLCFPLSGPKRNLKSQSLLLPDSVFKTRRGTRFQHAARTA